MPDWNAINDDDGYPIHLRMGLSKNNQGPADPPDPEFDHWGCWCSDSSCPGPPQCAETSWPFTVNDSQCIKAARHNGKHRDIDGFEWGGDD